MREVDLFGIPITVGTPEELLAATGSSPSNIHLVLRVEDEIGTPYPALAKRRVRTICEGCRHVCWQDPLSVVDPRATVLCMHCVAERVAQDPNATPVMLAAAAQVKEALRAIRRKM